MIARNAQERAKHRRSLENVLSKENLTLLPASFEALAESAFQFAEGVPGPIAHLAVRPNFRAEVHNRVRDDAIRIGRAIDELSKAWSDAARVTQFTLTAKFDVVSLSQALDDLRSAAQAIASEREMKVRPGNTPKTVQVWTLEMWAQLQQQGVSMRKASRVISQMLNAPSGTVAEARRAADSAYQAIRNAQTGKELKPPK